MKNKGILFVIAPQYEGDTLYVLARTKKILQGKDARTQDNRFTLALNSYFHDDYFHIDDFDGKKEMLDFVKKNCKFEKPVYI